MKIQKEELMKKNAAAIELTDGLYNAAIVGYMVSKRAPYNDPDGTPYEAVRFCFQLKDDAENIKCVQSPDYRLSFSEKSKFYAQLSSWSKANSPENLWTKMETAGFIEDDAFNLDKFLGKSIGLMTTMKVSKKDASKMFPEFTWTPSKVKDSFSPVLAEDGKEIPLWIPDFIEDGDVVETKSIDGFVWKRYEEKEEEKTEDKPKKLSVRSQNKVEAENDDIPF